MYGPPGMAGSSSNLRSQPISSARDAPSAAFSTQAAGAGGWRAEHAPRSASASHESRQVSSFPTHTAWNGPVPPSTSSSSHPQRPRQSEARQHAGSTSHPPVSASDSVSSGRAVPVPSEEQVHDYLVTHMGQREGLHVGWEIQGHKFDVYALFKSVIQMGGSSSVTQQDQWTYIATMLRFPMTTQSSREHQRVGLELRDFFLRLLGGLEILWEKTAEADRPKAPHRAFHSYSTSEAIRRQDLSLAALSPTRPSWLPGHATPDDRADYLPTPNTSHFKSQHLQVQDLTNSTPPRISKSPQPGYSIQPRGSASQNTYQNSQPQSYAQSIQPTPSPVHDQPQRVAPTTSGRYQEPDRASSSNVVDPPPAAGRAGTTHTQPTGHPGSRRPSNATQASSSLRGMDYDPPVVTSFEQLVDIRALPLPPAGSGLAVSGFAGPYLQYAYRAHELRSSIRKMSAGEAHRHISAEEILWWNKLVLLLQKNPKVVIPKPLSSATSTQPPPFTDVHQRDEAPALPSTINPNSIRNLLQAPVGSQPLPTPSSTLPAGLQADPSSQISDPKLKKKRGRPPALAPALVGTQEGQGGPQTTGTDGAPAPVKRKRGRPPKRKTNDDPDHAGALLRQTKKQLIDAEGQVAPVDQLDSVLPTPVSAPTLSQQIDQNSAAGSQGLLRQSSATPALEPPVGSRSIPAADFLRTIQAKQGSGAGPAQDEATAGEGSSASMPVTLAAAAAQFEHDHLEQGASSIMRRVGSSGQSVSPSMSASRSKAAKARWDRYRAQAAMQAQGGPSDFGTPTLPPAPSDANTATPIVSNSQPVSPSASASANRSKAAKARWERYRAQAANQAQGGPSDFGTPTFVRAPSVVNSASPLRVLDLSGSRMSHAQLTERDAKTPTKVILKSRPSQLSRLSQSDAPNDVTDAPGDGAKESVVEDEDETFNPFMELSQSWAVPEPIKKSDPFVPYAPARKPVHRDAEEDAMPEEVDLAALAAVLSAELGGTEHAGVEVVDQDQDFEIQDQPPTSQSGRKGKSKAAGQGKGVPARRQVVEPIVEIVTTRSPLTKRGKRATRLAERNDLEMSPNKAKPLSATPPEPSSVRAAKGKSSEPTLAHRTRSGPSQRTPLSVTPLLAAQQRPTARRTVQRSSVLRLTRSLGGPPSSALRDRHVAASPRQIGRKQGAARPAPKRMVRSPSIVMIIPPAGIKAKASKPSKAHLKVPVLDSGRTPRGGAVDRAVISIPIRAARRRRLILLGYYDAFRDDDSDEEEETIQRAHASLRPFKIQPSRSKARSIRPREPEMLPPRFAHRPGPALVEPFQSVLDEKSLSRRAVEHRCGWKGCDAVLGSEALLQRHVDFRKHVLSGRFETGPGNAQTLWRCHWRACEGPCFESEEKLSQHVVARHISRVLNCPYKDCDLASPNVWHLSRHVMKQHEEDEPRPLADLSVRLAPPSPLEQPLPETARTDELTTPRVPGSRYGSEYRREWARLRVKNNCFGGDHPIIHVEHPPHMLQTQEEDGAESDDSEDEERLYAGVEMAETRLLDKAEGRRSRWELVVAVPTRRELARDAALATSG